MVPGFQSFKCTKCTIPMCLRTSFVRILYRMTRYLEAGSSDGFAAAVGQCVLRLRHMRMSTAIMNECGRVWKKSTMTYF